MPDAPLRLGTGRFYTAPIGTGPDGEGWTFLGHLNPNADPLTPPVWALAPKPDPAPVSLAFQGGTITFSGRVSARLFRLLTGLQAPSITSLHVAYRHRHRRRS